MGLSGFRAVTFTAIFLFGAFAQAQDYHLLSNNSSTPHQGILVAQADDDDAYDPFADYSEFEESVEEEEDLNFFRNGRLLTLGFTAGLRSFTGNLGKIYSSSGIYGLNLTFFFDLRFGMQFGFLSSSHALDVKSNSGAANVQGTVALTDISLNLKYYFNTQNVTKGLADLNPYIIGGVSTIQRTISLRNTSGGAYAKDSAFGFNLGAGIEIPMLKNKMYFGLQGAYQLVGFSDENRAIKDSNDIATVNPSGDSWTGLGMLGINF